MSKPATILRHLAYYAPLVMLFAVWMFSKNERKILSPSEAVRTDKAEYRASANPPPEPAPPPIPAGRDVRSLIANKIAADQKALAGAGENFPVDFLDRIVTDKTISFPLPDGTTANGIVEMIDRDATGTLFVQGRLTTPSPGSYFFQRQTAEGVAGPFVGNVRFDGKPDGWKIEPTPDLKAARFVPRKLDEILCVNYSKPPAAPEILSGDTEQIPQDHPTNVPIPPYQTIIPLQSLPGAIGVIYLDFDGETGPFPGWGDFNAVQSNANNTQIFDVWRMVCEDFQGFNLNITTDRKVFDNAPVGRRQQVIITPTTTAAPGAGGVANLNSYNWSPSRPCWAFITTGKSAAEVISHEIGHTLGLRHDGRTSPLEEYYGGHGDGSVGWAPIMGVGYSEPLTQWSKGEYLNADETQDDLAVIVGNNNDVDYRIDDNGATLATAKYLEIQSNNSVIGEGIIETSGDTDAFRFTTIGGLATLNANTVALNPNLDIFAEIVNATTLAVIASNNPDTGINATVTFNLAAGDYLLRVRGTGRGVPLGDGYTNYGCIGSYTLSGSVIGGIKPERFSIAENSANAAAVGTVMARNAHGADPLTWAIASGNTSGAFAIDSTTGAITVANSAVLNYETLSLRWDDPSTIELFVTITNAATPSLNESIRTVVTVTDVNELPVLAGGAATVLEHTRIGSVVATINASDQDRFQFPIYSITGGNTGNHFAIDSNTGKLSVASYIDIATETMFNLSVTVTDQGTPALSNTAAFNITVINIADGYEPGRIVRTYFDGIGNGTAVTSLTTNAKFPNSPSSEQYLTAFDGQAHGDSFGSTIRGYLIPPVTGTYQFWIASDDASELRFSTNATPASASVIATVSGATGQYAWTTNVSQQSTTRNLTAGQPYYIEARHKEGTGLDHVAVAWTGPGISTRQVIPGAYLTPFYQNYAPKPVTAFYTIRENALPGQPVGVVTSSDVNAQDTFNYIITAGNTGGAFAIDATTGQLSVALAGLLNATTAPTYSLTIRSTDNGTPSLNGTGTVTVSVRAAAGISETGIVQEIWTGINGTPISNLTSNSNYPHKPTLRRALTSFDSGADYADNYGSRIRALFIPPTSDSYRFYIASDDASSLLFSNNATGSGAAQIASVSGWVARNAYTANASQTSTVRTLVAGQAVYLEALHKEGGGGDHVSVAYTNSTDTTPTVIPSSMLLPFNINAAPVFSPSTYNYNVTAATATVGQVIGTPTATEPNGEPLRYAILSGNSQGAFTMNSNTGQITVANPAGLSNGSFTLTIAAQDGGLSAVYPLASGTATVVIQVTASNTAPVWVSNPVVKPGANESVAYNETLMDSATDVNSGDTLTFTKLSGPSWLAVAMDGALTGTPGISSDGLNAFMVRVTDSFGIFADATLQINVTGINRPPVFTASSLTQAAAYGLPVAGSIAATDSNVGDILTYSKLSGPPWLTVATNGTLTGTPTFADAGLNVFNVQVTDAAGLTADGTLNITLTAPTLYLDMNEVVAGSGASGAVTWSAANNIWSGSASGTVATQAWVNGGLGVFSAGTDGGATDITVSGTQTLRGLTVEEGTPVLTGGTLSLTGTTPIFTIGSGRSASISSVITGATGLRQVGSGQGSTGSLTLGGSTSNTYSGLTTFASNGHLILSKTGGAVAIPGDLEMAAPGVRGIVSTTVDNQFAAGSVLRFTSTGDTRLEIKGTTQTLGGIENTGVTGVYHCVQHSEFGTPAAVDATSQLILDVAGTNSFNFNTAAGSLRNYNGGVLSLVKNGTGSQTLSGNNVSYTGATTVNAGRLVFAGTYGSPSLSIATGATLELSVASGTVDYATSTIIGTGTLLKTGAGSARWNTQAGTFALGAGSLVDVRAGILIASASSNENWSGNLSSLHVNSGATINGLTFGPAVFDALTGGGAVQGNGTNTLTIGSNNTAAGTYNTTAGAATFSGVISSVSSLIKTGTGTQTLSGINIYTGTTTINQGGILVTGSLANTVTTVAAAGTLGGTGTLAGPVTNNGTLAPGTTGPGSITINNTLTLAPSSRILWEISNWTGTAGTAWDRATVNTLNLTATSANPLTIRLADLALANFTESNKTFVLVQTSSGITGFAANKFTIDTTGLTLPKGTWAIGQSGNNLVLAYTRANTAPVFTAAPILMSATQGLAISGNLAATDPDIGDTLTYAKISGPEWLTVAPDGTLAGTPLGIHIGSNIFPVSVTDGITSVQATLLITVNNPDPDTNDNGITDTWEIAKFGNADPGANPPGDDPDGDGLANLMEFALDTHPRVGGPSPLIHDFHDLVSGSHQRLTVLKNPLATHLQFSVEVCSALVDWNTTQTTIESDTATELIVRDNLTLSDASSRFIRLKVQLIAPQAQ